MDFKQCTCAARQDLRTIRAKMSDGVVCYVSPLNRSDAAAPETLKNMTFNVRLSFSAYLLNTASDCFFFFLFYSVIYFNKRQLYTRPEKDMGWVNPWVGMGWVNFLEFFLGWVQGICDGWVHSVWCYKLPRAKLRSANIWRKSAVSVTACESVVSLLPYHTEDVHLVVCVSDLHRWVEGWSKDHNGGFGWVEKKLPTSISTLGARTDSFVVL